MNRSCAVELGEHGPLARAIADFAVRPGQQAMSERVAEALATGTTVVCEAGTGIGKTFAYLVPALLSGRRIIVSTGTRTLQDQLFHRDLPVVRAALGVPVTVALLKGRGNYLCTHRLLQALAAGSGGRESAAALHRIQSWSMRTRSGDIAEVDDVPEDSPLWPTVTSTADNCLGQDCRHYQECWVLRARRAAQAAEIVVVNHHLFLADATLKDQGFGEVLPGAEAVIFDEAHQLPQTAAQFFGSGVSGRQLMELARDTVAAQSSEAGDDLQLREAAHRIEKAVRDLRLAFGVEEGRADWDSVKDCEAVHKAIGELDTHMQSLATLLEAAAKRGPQLANCHKRCAALAHELQQFDGAAGEDVVRWFETHQRGFSLHLTPLDIAALFQERVASRSGALVFTSATLAVGEDFNYFTHQLGLESAICHCFESPFDFARQALLYLPDIGVDPRQAGYTMAVVQVAVPLLEASRGRAFLLFTSHRALREAYGLLQERVTFPLLVQGAVPRGELLERFRNTPNAVLLGTSSFWEGVDVRGEALSCVIIDKLPFAAPEEPLTQARIRMLRRRGVNPFREYQLPEAIIALKQGVGRLIRDSNDRGVLCLCDPRLRTKSYGRQFLSALPPMRKTSALRDVQAFFATQNACYRANETIASC